jgi:hypothetical protein
MTEKIKEYLNNTLWYHATLLEHFINIHNNGIKVDINKDTSNNTDFGYGFYLTNDHKRAEWFISNLLKYEVVEGVPVVLEFNFSPLQWFTLEEYSTKIFPKHNEEFGKFVFENRLNNIDGAFQHRYDLIFGVMSDGYPTGLMIDYELGLITKEAAVKALTKPYSMKQLSLHNQELCDIVKISRAYSFDISNTENRKELNLNDYKI